MNNLLTYRGSEIHYENATNKGIKVNVTEFAKAFPDKNLSTIINSQEIKEYVEKLSEIKNFSSADLLEVRKGGTPDKQGTWAHEMVALRVAQKLSTEFAIMVDTKIRELLTRGVTKLTPSATLKVGERMFMSYRGALVALGVEYKQQRLAAFIGGFPTEFAKWNGAWYMSESFYDMLGAIESHARLRTEISARKLTGGKKAMRLNK
jgi:hypothetical protein